MFRALSKSWWLLALCGIVDAVCAATNLLMLSPDGSLILRRFALPNAVWIMSILALVAGTCAVGAGLTISDRGNSWLLSLHGLALSVYGLIGISPAVRAPLSFRPISLLLVLMAISIGAFALRTAQTVPGGARDRSFLRAFGAASIGFALSFAAVGFGWLRLGTPQAFWIWMSSYFALCAIFMLCLALRGRGEGISEAGPTEALPPIRGARPAH